MDFASLIFRHAMEAIENSNEKELRQVLLWTPWIVHQHNQRGFTLLHIACSDTVCSLDPEERRANIERLLAAGADPLATFWEGDEPVSCADMCDTFGYEDDARFLREYIATGMWTRSAHPRNTGCCEKDHIRVHLNSWRSPDQLIRVPRLTRSDGRYTVGGLTLVFFAYNVGEIKHKRELIEFLRHMNCTTTDPQPRHLGMQCWINFLVRGCYHPAKGRILRTGEFSLLDLENPLPSSEMRHRRKDTAFTDASFNELKQKCGMRCMSCGSVEGGRHYKKPLHVTKLEMGHMDPRKSLSHPNCIPMCNMCNMVYKNCAVFNANGFIIEWLGGKGPGTIKDSTSPVSHPLALVPDDDDEEDEAEEFFDASEIGDTPLEDVYIDSSCISLMAPDTPKLKTVFPPVPLPSPFPVSMSARLPKPLPKPLPASFTGTRVPNDQYLRADGTSVISAMDSILEEIGMTGQIEIHDDDDKTVYVYEQILSETGFLSVQDGLKKFTIRGDLLTQANVAYTDFVNDITTFQANNKYTMMTDIICDDTEFNTNIKMRLLKPTGWDMKLQMRYMHDGTYPSTEASLRSNAYSDVLMPAIQKRPMYKHKNMSWSWNRYNSFKNDNRSITDIAVLLKTLCVVDVDSEKMAIELEQTFPYLGYVPMERTAAGRHYWFMRSEMADRCGYYDGPCQTMKGIDFKSVTF
eukprot:gene393-1789_t